MYEEFLFLFFTQRDRRLYKLYNLNASKKEIGKNLFIP